MKLSNRLLGILILLSIIGAFYIFYQVFFRIKLTQLEINSNIWIFSWSIENIKFSKDFNCIEKKCIINNIPPFEYEININKQKYKIYKNKINLFEINKLNIFLEKDIKLEKLEQKQLSKREKILNINKNNLNFWSKTVNYNNIIAESNYVFFKDNNKLYFYNIKNNNSFKVWFKPKINYIKKLNQNQFLINTKIWTFVFNVLNKKLEYFSLFSDFVLINNNYIWVINDDDITRKKNFDLENNYGNILLFYNRKTKEKYILKNINNKIDKIYKLDTKIYIEDNIWNKFEVKWF